MQDKQERRKEGKEGREGNQRQGEQTGDSGNRRDREHTPCLNEKIDSGKSHLQDLARWWRTAKGFDVHYSRFFHERSIQKISIYFHILSIYTVNLGKMSVDSNE